MSKWTEPSRQNWIKDSPDSRVYGSREVMEARIESAFSAMQATQAYDEVALAAYFSRLYGEAIAHWGLALMELDEREAVL